MKKLFVPVLVAAFVSVLLLSCSKHNNSHGNKYVTIDTAVVAGAEYELSLQPYGDDDDVATILTQATEYSKSEIVPSASGFTPIYHFVDSLASHSAQNVVLAITEGSSRCRHANDTTFVAINFTFQ